ncbi:MAG: winged helix-turn-helix transcriptional regulator [Promethearchaeota archaeon]|nr:MAG: winged helix-turn-helix transcriptional regulator [Candidatus Lokiarchaeota archaeon]
MQKVDNNIQVKKFNRFFLLKFILIFFSLILLSIILYYLILSFEETFFAPDKVPLGLVIISLLIATIFIFSLFIALTVKEYRSYFMRKAYIKKGRSYLTFSDIFENENRINILTQILNNPGIHHNELLRSCNLQKGQLRWHLEVLLKYRIIKKERYGQYSMYFPITSSFESNDSLKNLFVKSKTTSEILNIIQENPGINSSEISRVLNLSRNTIKYHIDKLSEENLIYLTKKGRKIELYPN